MSQGGMGGNVYQQSANAYQNAIGGTMAGMGYNPGVATTQAQNANANPAQAMFSAGSQGYSPTGYSSSGYNAFTGSGDPMRMASGYKATGYDAAQMGNADQVTAGQLASTDLNPYMNPYTTSVIDQTAADMNRAREIQINQSEDAAAAAGAFGGSRHGIADAETNRNFYDRLGATSGALRDQGFRNAQQAALTDIANTMNADLANQNANMAVDQFNTGSTNQARQFSADAENQAGQTGAQASMVNAQLAAQMQRAQMDAVNQARMFGADARNTARQFGANAANQAGQFNANLGQQNNQFNAGLGTQNNQFNAGLLGDISTGNANRQLTAGLANQNAINGYNDSRRNAMMAGGAQLGNLANLGFGFGNNITNQQNQHGAAAQQIMQAILNNGAGMFGQHMGQGNLGLGQLMQAVGASPAPVSQETSTNPGLLGVLGGISGFF